MSVYPQSLTKISEASIHKVDEDKGQNLKKWTGDSHYSAYGESYIVGLNIKDGEANGENTIIPAYDFIEKVADVVATDSTELENALKDSGVSTIFVSKDITLANDVTITASKTILGIHAKLNLNSKTITINAFNLDVYCKINGSCNIVGNGTIWFKDVLCANSSNPISAPNATKTYERFVKSSDYKTTYSYSDWTQIFKDNTFPWEDLQDALNAEATERRNQDNILQANIDAEEARAEAVEANLSSAISDEETRAKGVENGLRDDLNTEIARATYIESGLRTDLDNLSDNVDALVPESNPGQYVYGIAKDSENNFTKLTKRVATSIDTISNEDYTVPTVKAIKDYVDACIHAVYKPKGNITKSKLETVAFKASEDKLGFVYNFKATESGIRETVNTYSSDGTRLEIELEDNEDVAIIQDPNDSSKYIWNDFGGKIDLSDYYTKPEVNRIAIEATTEVIQGDNIDLKMAIATDGHTEYTVNANVESIAVDTNTGLIRSKGTASAHVTPITLSIDLAKANDISECETLFDDV